jgi:hypothetical protein
MVHAMASDRGLAPRVACALTIATTIAGIAACGPTVKPPSPPPEPGPVARMERPHPAAGPGRHVIVGEMCPQGAAGRPAVAPLVMRTLGWTDRTDEVSAAVERGSVPRFVVFGTDGKLAGAFDTLGLVEVAGSATGGVATGTYAGASPCTYDAAAKPAAGAVATRAEEPACGQATGGCGLAVGEIVRADDPPETPAFATGGACLSGNELAVDIDGDGRIESFPLSGVLDGIRGPAQEWSASPTATASCKPQFQLYGMRLAAEPDPGKGVDPKSVVLVDVLGVVDLDRDGRKELVLALRLATVRTIVVYTATGSPERLELAGEGASFTH